MIPIEDAAAGNDIVQTRAGTLAEQGGDLTVARLERALLARFPAVDAEEWDRTGLTVGDPAVRVTGVAAALDPTLSAVCAAAEVEANVLLTHHPLFLDPPAAVSSDPQRGGMPGAVAFEAARLGVACLSFHTALDVSAQAASVLPGMLRLDFERVLVPLAHDVRKGYGQLCAVRDEDGSAETLADLAARCTAVFGRPPRVWGDFARPVRTAVTATGSAGNVVTACLTAGVDCLICGEVKYHAALDAVQQGLCIIELGHDVSELPLATLLAAAAVDAGVAASAVRVLDQGDNWRLPDSIRL